MTTLVSHNDATVTLRHWPAPVVTFPVVGAAIFGGDGIKFFPLTLARGAFGGCLPTSLSLLKPHRAIGLVLI